jgi:endonuclease/exonuclease/phosphatase family metal-dependent hydrolase
MKLRLAVLVPLLTLSTMGMAGPQPGFRAVHSTPPRRSSASYLTVMSFNACGAACRDGEVSHTAAAVANAALARGAAVVMLQELCADQYRRIAALLATYGYAGRFTAATRAHACGADGGFGIAVFVRGPVTGSVVVDLPTRPGYERRALLGVSAMLAGRETFVAVVHLSPSPAAGLDEQLRVLAAYLGRRPDQPTLVGGDFNALPGKPGLRRVAAGPYIELDALHNAPTFDVAGRKIDYVFASAESFTDPRPSVVPTPMSDHRLYSGSLRVIEQYAV